MSCLRSSRALDSFSVLMICDLRSLSQSLCAGPLALPSGQTALVRLCRRGSRVAGRTCEEIVTQCRVVGQAGGARERLARLLLPVEPCQQMPARGPIGLVVAHAAGRHLVQGG